MAEENRKNIRQAESNELFAVSRSEFFTTPPTSMPPKTAWNLPKNSA
jgi:hypothetical protein